MSKDFKTLIDFLDRFEPEVTGKALVAPEGEVASKLERFAAGQCEKEERAEVCAILRSNPTWLRWLAERVKMTRGDAPAG
jgi:hypothetical protein